MEQQQWQRMPQGMPNIKVVYPQAEALPFQAREAINMLRGNIQLSGYDLKVIAVTSAVAHEGKSSIAFRLAKSMAGLNKRTLYIDCDIRNSVVMTRYDIQQKVIGLSEYLCGRVPCEGIIYKTNDQWMDMIFTGAMAPNPSELISGPLFGQLIRWVRENYDYVIVDTPPINAVIDGPLIAKHCDGAIMVVESGLTERAEAVRARQQLEYAGIKILGAVLNKVGTKKSGYGYGYGYGYGEKKDSKKAKNKKAVSRGKRSS